MKEYFGSRVEDIFNTMPERFRPDQVFGVDLTLGYNIKDDGGGKWAVTIKDCTIQVEKADGELPSNALMLYADAEAFVGGALGVMDAMENLMSGRLKVDGDTLFVANLLGKAFFPFKPVARISASTIINSMPDRFRADKAAGVSLKIGYDLASEQYTIILNDGTCTVKDSLDADCSVVMRMAPDVFVGMNTGKIDTTTAFTSGQVKIDGDMAAAGATAKYFKKFEADGAEAPKVEELISLKCVPSINQRFASGPQMGKWFAGLKDKKFYATKCPSCGRTQIPPAEACAWCRARTTEYVEVGPKATVTFIDVVYYASPDPLTGKVRSTPYGTLFMVLDGCSPGNCFSHELKSEDLPNIKISSRVRPVWAEERTGSYKDLLYFEIDE